MHPLPLPAYMPSFAELLHTYGDFAPTVDASLTTLGNAQQQLHVITTSPAYAEDYKQELTRQHTTTAEQLIGQTRQHLDQLRGNLLHAAAALTTPGDQTAQLLAETRQQRAWQRLRPQLDAGRHWSELLEEAAAGRDSAALVALRQELPAWTQAQREPVRGVNALQPAQRRPDLGEMLTFVDAAVFRVLGDDRGQGSAARTRLHVAAQHPLAVARLDQVTWLAKATGRTTDSHMGADRIAGAYVVAEAQRQAAAIEAMLATPGQG